MSNYKKAAKRIGITILAVLLGICLMRIPGMSIADISKAEAAFYPNYSLVFNAQYYAAHNPDVYEAFGNDYYALLQHFINNGMKEGRTACEEFNVHAYRNRYPDLQQSFGENYRAYFMHYIYCGKAEGRIGYPEDYKPQMKIDNERPVTEEEVRSYYDRAVFVGDSLMEGYRNYALTSADSWANASDFLAVRSYSLVHALKPSSEDDLQPVFQGERMNIWDAVASMDVDRVFIMFGTNDLVSRSPETILRDYMQLLDKIKEKNPQVELHIIGMPPAGSTAAKGNLCRQGIRDLNQLLCNNADSYGYSYIDLYSVLADKDGNLPDELCSDGLIHETRVAYQNGWDGILLQHAKDCIRQMQSQPTVSENQEG